MFKNLTEGTEKQKAYAQDIIVEMENTKIAAIKMMGENNPNAKAITKTLDLIEKFTDDFYQHAGDVIKDYQKILYAKTTKEKLVIIQAELMFFVQNVEGGKEWMKKNS